ncbi:MAG: 3-keto-5-aminohexanoate cleavage protein [Rhizobiaceae bacterium]|nr:3-keto-5-aminohexanoate cleavage protein [Rhizobiaceae bacterium]
MSPYGPRKVVLTCAVTGGGALGKNSGAVPITPAQIADSALAAASAGAAVLHIHVRDPNTGIPSMSVDLYREVVNRIRAGNPAVVLNLTTGMGARFIPGEQEPVIAAKGSTLTTPEARIAHVLALKPEICSLDLGSMNFGKHVVINTPEHVSKMADFVRQAGVKPELEVFDLSGLEMARRMIMDGEIAPPPLFQLCLGIAGGAPASPQTMLAMHAQLPADAVWAGFGIASASFPMLAQSFVLGGHVRVGLEDNLFLEKGVRAPSNSALVEKARAIVQQLGGSLATPDEARAILGLNGR